MFEFEIENTVIIIEKVSSPVILNDLEKSKSKNSTQKF